MFIKVKAQNPGHQGRSRAKRRFANGVEYQMEVVDRDEDFFSDAAEQFGDMTKINRAGYESLKRDPCFSIIGSDETSVGISEKVLEEVRAHAAKLSVKVSDLEIENTRLKADLAAAVKAKDEAEFRLAELEDSAGGVDSKAKDDEGEKKSGKGGGKGRGGKAVSGTEGDGSGK